MPDLNPLRFTPTAEPSAPVTFGFDVMIEVRVVADDGAILLDTTEEPISLVGLLAGCDAADLAPVIAQFAIPWLLKQRGLADG